MSGEETARKRADTRTPLESPGLSPAGAGWWWCGMVVRRVGGGEAGVPLVIEPLSVEDVSVAHLHLPPAVSHVHQPVALEDRLSSPRPPLLHHQLAVPVPLVVEPEADKTAETAHFVARRGVLSLAVTLTSQPVAQVARAIRRSELPLTLLQAVDKRAAVPRSVGEVPRAHAGGLMVVSGGEG